MSSEIHRTRAEIAVGAPAEAVYAALTDVLNWPLLYPWVAHTEIAWREGAKDRSRFWAVRPGAGESLRVWESHRTLDDGALRMDFEQQGTVGAITGLGGSWLFVPLPDGGCRVESHHWFTADGDPQATVAELDRHGALQMRTLKAAVESSAERDRLTLRATRSTVVPGPAERVYAGLLEAVTGTPAGPGDTAEFVTTTDGRAVVIATAPHTVVVKQLEPPAGFDLYRTTWRMSEEPDGIRVTAERLAVARPEGLTDARRAELLNSLGFLAEADLPQGQFTS
ncbi:aromatase/cyclase [Amycolatopsis sp. NPDC059657]|uniref:aromatase/cyclase n=1 Tax=Amycolatopsis sp. NPDC059657 TaxID=3346899 RepID=UPI0036718ED7